MSSLFNSKNNRFDILNSDDNTNKERNKNKEKNKDKNNIKQQEQQQEEPRNFNSFKNDSQPFYEDRRNNRRFNERRNNNSKEMEERNKEMEKRNKELEKIKKEKEREEALKETNFPDLIQNNPNKKKDETQNQESNQPQPIINFLEKVKNNLTKDERREAKNIIKPGWVCMEKAANSNQIIYTYGKQTYFPREKQPIDVLNALVKLHENQIQQYDSLWGEGAYEEHYKSPYYDYEYFNRLDEQYEDEMERQEQEDRVKEREYDNDYYTY